MPERFEIYIVYKRRYINTLFSFLFYRRGHSAETAPLHVMDSLYTAVDNKKATALVCLDIAVAFDTIDHSVHISRLENDFGVDGAAAGWLLSYLDRPTAVRQARPTHTSPARCRSDFDRFRLIVPQP